MGGVNYLKNILYAINSNPNSKIEAYVFIHKNSDTKIIEVYKNLAKVIYINQPRPIWLILRVYDKIFKTEKALNYLFNKYKIEVLSHNVILNDNFKIKSIAWFPDFQHLHLPELLGEQEVQIRNKVFKQRIQKAKRIILSSYDSFIDMSEFSPDNINKARVLHFVTQIDPDIYQITEVEAKNIFTKHNINKKYFFLPNQLWKHKNHFIVFKAIKLLKDNNKSIQVLCTGNNSSINNDYINELNSFVSSNGLQSEIKILGLIDYRDVQCLMRYSVSVINPSLFEGWSSSVEECKSLGKNIILSNINVHIEQAPPNAIYFDPKNEIELSQILNKKWDESDGGPDYSLEVKSREQLKSRTIEMSNEYEKIVLETIN
jgi:glycosyltransferase involved in cell wall biosynthesis